MSAPTYTSPTDVAQPTAVFQFQYHPLFDSQDADTVLQSTDGVYYRVHSYTLRTSCGLFETLFSLPQPTVKASDDETCDPEPEREALTTHESSQIITLLLIIISGRTPPLPIPKWGDADAPYGIIQRVLYLAEAWDAPGAIAAIRPSLSSPTLLKRDPIALYVIACHFGWKEERRLASTYTLTINLLDIHSETQAPTQNDMKRVAFGSDGHLAHLSSTDLMALLRLQRQRRDVFRALIDSPERFTAGNSSQYQCARCGVTAIDNMTWGVFKHTMILEMDRRPLGDGITGAAVADVGGDCGLGVVSWPEADRCWAAHCTKDDCGGLNYDKPATLKQINSCILALPLHVDDL